MANLILTPPLILQETFSYCNFLHIYITHPTLGQQPAWRKTAVWDLKEQMLSHFIIRNLCLCRFNSFSMQSRHSVCRLINSSLSRWDFMSIIDNSILTKFLNSLTYCTSYYIWNLLSV